MVGIPNCCLLSATRRTWRCGFIVTKRPTGPFSCRPLYRPHLERLPIVSGKASGVSERTSTFWACPAGIGTPRDTWISPGHRKEGGIRGDCPANSPRGSSGVKCLVAPTTVPRERQKKSIYLIAKRMPAQGSIFDRPDSPVKSIPGQSGTRASVTVTRENGDALMEVLESLQRQRENVVPMTDPGGGLVRKAFSKAHLRLGQT